MFDLTGALAETIVQIIGETLQLKIDIVCAL